METLLGELVKQGLLGLLAAISLWWAWKKDRQMHILYRRWLEKTERQTTKYHELATEVTETIKELARAQADTERTLAKLCRRNGGDP